MYKIVHTVACVQYSQYSLWYILLTFGELIFADRFVTVSSDLVS
uniref:Uncharacterized protein n=1 Tax=Anguilla anguilla TaxID=7936 RepID=A0A0E9SQP3_ANGAN